MHNIYGGKLKLKLSDLAPDQVNVSVIRGHLVPLDEYHPAQKMTIKLRRSSGPPLSSHHRNPNWNWRESDFQALYAAIAEIDWVDLFEIRHADRSVELLIKNIRVF